MLLCAVLIQSWHYVARDRFCPQLGMAEPATLGPYPYSLELTHIRYQCSRHSSSVLFWHLPSPSSQTNRPSDYCWISSWLGECKVVYHSSQVAKDVIRLRIQLEQSRCMHGLRLELLRVSKF